MRNSARCCQQVREDERELNLGFRKVEIGDDARGRLWWGQEHNLVRVATTEEEWKGNSKKK